MNVNQENIRDDDFGEIDDQGGLEFDDKLYSPTIRQNAKLDASKKVFDPAAFPYFGFFISLYMIFPVIYNLYRFRQWRLLTGSVLLFLIWVEMTFIVLISLVENRIIDASYIGLIVRASLILLGIFYSHSQKKLIRWFYMSDGESLNGFLFGIPFFALMLFVPSILRIFFSVFISMAAVTIQFFS